MILSFARLSKLANSPDHARGHLSKYSIVVEEKYSLRLEHNCCTLYAQKVRIVTSHSALSCWPMNQCVRACLGLVFVRLLEVPSAPPQQQHDVVACDRRVPPPPPGKRAHHVRIPTTPTRGEEKQMGIILCWWRFSSMFRRHIHNQSRHLPGY